MTFRNSESSVEKHGSNSQVNLCGVKSTTIDPFYMPRHETRVFTLQLSSRRRCTEPHFHGAMIDATFRRTDCNYD